MVHGGLRYLQNFDLGLVREALLERALMVKLAPHLVKPLAVPGRRASDGKRPDRAIGVGLNMYDVMARGRGGGKRRRGRGVLEPGPPPHDRRAEEVLELVPGARGRATRPPPTSSTTARPTTSRLVLTVLGEAERFGAVLA